VSTTFPAPTTGRHLSPDELRAVLARHVQDVRDGVHVAQLGTDQRWHVRIHQDDDVDVWLISWTTEQGTELHDHGGSAGAFTVVEGTLDEYVWSGADAEAPGVLVDHARTAGETVVFGPDYVHDVRNHRQPPAVSVHVYSPPISSMHFYDVVEDRLDRWARSWTDDPETPAPERVTFGSVDEMLATARSGLTRLSPYDAAQAVRDGAQLVDIRPEWQRRADGEIPGAVVVERNHLEWRLHPASDARLPWATAGTRWVVYCTEGYTSSLAAASLVSLGLDASDVVGGIHAWRAAGLPTVPGGTPVEGLVAG
jgi:rhodanese-related sulfurtransferase/predicted metal-dependent enzyme (double-stranded beta helix superfamily)